MLENYNRIIDYVREIPEEHFDMNIELSHHWKDLQAGHCGAAGCVAGYAPMIFPEHFEYQGEVDIRYQGKYHWTRGFQELLGLDFKVICALFDTEYFKDGPEAAQKPAYVRSKAEQIQTMEWHRNALVGTHYYE